MRELFVEIVDFELWLECCSVNPCFALSLLSGSYSVNGIFVLGETLSAYSDFTLFFSSS